MKFKITMKDPDGVYECINDAAETSAKSIEGLSDEERADIKEKCREEIDEVCSEWFEWSEYLTVEIDTEAKTCTVVPK